jgi:hypothetical protein
MIHTGDTISSVHPANSPVRVAYEAFVGPNHWIYSYDPTALYHAIRPDDPLLAEVGPGTNTIDGNGGNVFTVGPGNQYYLVVTNVNSLDSAIETLLDILPSSVFTGTIEVRNAIDPPDAPGRFDLQVDGVTRESDASNGDTTGPISVPVGTSHSVGELAGTGTSLSDYSSAISCTRNGSQADSGPGSSLSGIAVQADDSVVCTITNTIAAYPRPKGATPVRVSLVPAYEQCAAPNAEHGAPLVFGSCDPPSPISDQLTVGTADANGKGANSTGSVAVSVVPGNPSNLVDDADARVATSITDVRAKSDLSDYTGQVQTVLNVGLTDHQPTANGDEPQTTQDFPFRVTVPCTATVSTAIGSTCSLTTTADTLMPGAVPESKRSIWALHQVQVFDGGPDGDVTTTGDNTLFETQGVFVP